MLANMPTAEPPLKYAQPIFGGQDFRQFYAGARLLVHGHNPYDWHQVKALQQVDWYDTVHVSVSPPSTFLPYIAFAPLPYAAAMYAHVAMNVVLLTLLAVGWRRLLFPHQPNLSWLFGFGLWIWMPVMLLVAIGQVSAMVLAGFTGWLLAMRSQRSAWAGAALLLCWIKPHLGLPLLAFAVSIHVRQRMWSSLLIFAMGTLLLLLLPLAFRPAVYAEWHVMLDRSPPTQWLTATLQAWGREHFSQLFYPIGLSLWGASLLLAALCGWRSAGKPRASWAADGVLLLTLDLMIAIHAFSYDYVLLLPGFLAGLGVWQLYKAPAALLWLVLDGFFFAVKVLAWINEWDLWLVAWLALPLTLLLLVRGPILSEAESTTMPTTP